MHWQKLAETALLGTEHTALDEKTIQALSDLGIPNNTEAPVLLAKGASAWSSLRRTGFMLGTFTLQGFTKPLLSTESLLPQTAVDFLLRILRGPNLSVLPEFLKICREKGYTLPATVIPHLMETEAAQPLWPNIEPLLGNSAEWLLGQNPKWRELLGSSTNSDWETASQAERLALLRHWRKSDPAKAVEALKSTWGKEDYRDKARFLAVMAEGLSAMDEAFLETCLDEKRTEVRLEAAALLSKLPDSALTGRNFKRAASFVEYKANNLTINIFDIEDDTGKRDCFDKVSRHAAFIGLGGRLAEAMALVPPIRWESHFQKSPAALIQLAKKTDWETNLVAGWAFAAVYFKSEAWATALLEAYETGFLEKGKDGEKSYRMTIELTKIMSLETSNQLIVKYLTREPFLPTGSIPSFWLIQNTPSLDVVATRVLTARIREAEKKQPLHLAWGGSHVLDAVKALSQKADLSEIEALTADWENSSDFGSTWAPHIERMLELLRFRKAMQDSFG